MPDVAAAVKAWLCALVLTWTVAALAQPAGTQSAVMAQHAGATAKSPAITLANQQSSLAGTCGGNAFDVSTFINVDASASADVKVTAPGVGLIEEFTDATGDNLGGSFKGPFPTFHIRAFGGGLPPNTPITITITTYTLPNLGGAASSVSSLTFNCTSGVVLRAPANIALAIPSLSRLGLAGTAALLLLLGAAALRRAGYSRRR